MADRKRRHEDCDFPPPAFRSNADNKRGRANAKVSSRSLSRSTSGSTSSSCADASVGHLDAVRGDVLAGRYEVLRELGTGTFGKVFQCNDRKYNQKVAVKVVRSIKRYVESALIEGSVLDAVYSRQKKDKTDFCVKMYSHFDFNDHYCLVFETLGISLYDLIKRNDYTGFPLRHVKDLARQLLGSLAFLESMRLIHTDLKLENILFQNSDNMAYMTVMQNGKKKEIQTPSSFKIKIIDFGGATFDCEHKSTIVNTRQYRGPEVTLEAGWSFPSDIWSVGCMIAEIYSGELFFQTRDDMEHIALMERCIGPFPFSLIDRSKRSKDYFQRNGFVRLESLSSTSREYVARALTVREFFSLNPGDASSGMVEFMSALLELEPLKRATASQALRMHFLDDVSPEPDRERGRLRDCEEGFRGDFTRSSSIRTDRELLFDQGRGEQRRDDRRRSEGGGQGRRGGDDSRIAGRAEEKRAMERVRGDRAREDASRGQDRKRRNERDSDRYRGAREERGDRAVRGGRALESDRASGVRRLLSHRIREENGRGEGSHTRDSNRARKPTPSDLNGHSEIGYNNSDGHRIRSPNHNQNHNSGNNDNNNNNGNNNNSYSGKGDGDGGRNFGTENALSCNNGLTSSNNAPRNGRSSTGDANNEGSYKNDNSLVQKNHNSSNNNNSNNTNHNNNNTDGGGGSKNNCNGSGNHTNNGAKGSNSSYQTSNARRDFDHNERHRSGRVQGQGQEQDRMTQQRDRLGTDRPGTLETGRGPYRSDRDRDRDRGGSQGTGSKGARMNESRHNSTRSSSRGDRDRNRGR